MLGYTRKFMDETYEQIIDFAELREFENRPFKQLSLGMKSRLAFSIASLVRPDILILDEVLSVTQVREMCTKILWLHKGRQVEYGSDVPAICDRYQEFLDGTRNRQLNTIIVIPPPLPCRIPW